MKTLGGATLAGIIVALAIIYWLQPLNSGATALVLIFCISSTNIIISFISSTLSRTKPPRKSSHKKKRHKAKLILLALLASSCTGITKGGGGIHIHYEPPAVHSPIFVPARGFLRHNQSPPKGFGAYGYIIFTARPSESNSSRYMAICQEYQSSIQPNSEFHDIPQANLMMTFWLLHELPESEYCSDLIYNYDYAQATMIARYLDKLNTRGPILVAWRHPFTLKLAPTDEALSIDMSDFTREEDISEAFRIWKDQISQNSNNWNHGFSLALIRVELRSFINTYGQQIVAVISGSPTDNSEDKSH